MQCFNAIFEFLGQFFIRCILYFSQSCWLFQDRALNHANFWYEVQYPLNMFIFQNHRDEGHLKNSWTNIRLVGTYLRVIFKLNPNVTWSRGNESDVRNIHFELHAKTIDKFLCFTLFLNLKNCSYLCNQMSDCDDVWVIMKLFKWTNNLYWKIKFEYCRHVTHSPWSCQLLVSNIELLGFGSKCSIWNRKVIYIEKSNLNTADIWLIPLDRVTNMWFSTL